MRHLYGINDYVAEKVSVVFDLADSITAPSMSSALVSEDTSLLINPSIARVSAEESRINLTAILERNVFYVSTTLICGG